MVRLTDRIGIGVLTRVVNRDLIDEVLAATGTREQRTRLLPARVVVYYVMALCLFYEDAYEEVMRKLVAGLQSLRSWHGDWRVPTTSAISQARTRLGPAPMQALFQRVAVPIARRSTPGAWCGSWRTMAIDGVVLDTPDTTENANAFGYSGGDQVHRSPFPQVRIVALAECGTHAVVAAEIAPIRVGERELAHRLLQETEPDMLLLADRGFYSYEFWKAAHEHGTQMLWRVKSQLDLPVYEALPDGSYRSSVAPKSMRSDIKRGKSRRIERYEIPVRVIEYQVNNRPGGEVIRLITSLLDHEEAPAADLAATYHERWEIEILLDEIETHQFANSRVLRSKTPALIEQEIWALLLTHYAVRHLMTEAADHIDIDPDRLSFIRSLRVVRRQVMDQAGYSPLSTMQGAADRDRRNSRSPESPPA
jgi:hypothetical protein